MDPKAYYDRFSESYEKERHHGYHALVDDLESSLVRGFAVGGRVLEAGCGTGLVLSRVDNASAFGADLSRGMVARAGARGLRVVQADLTRLPYRDASFDVVCSFKVLAHVPDRAAALRELTRVVRPGGKLIVEYYNRHSLRFLVKRLGPSLRIANGTTEADVYTRFDTLGELRAALPGNVRFVGVRGVRAVTPSAKLIDLPVVGPLLRFAERRAFDSPLARLAGFLIVIAERTG
jgi:SAM-dependent methyltransferase